jgi:hypothetical protein
LRQFYSLNFCFQFLPEFTSSQTSKWKFFNWIALTFSKRKTFESEPHWKPHENCGLKPTTSKMIVQNVFISLFFHIMQAFWQRKVNENEEKKRKNSIYIFYCRAVLLFSTKPFAKKTSSTSTSMWKDLESEVKRNEIESELNFTFILLSLLGRRKNSHKSNCIRRIRIMSNCRWFHCCWCHRYPVKYYPTMFEIFKMVPLSIQDNLKKNR